MSDWYGRHMAARAKVGHHPLCDTRLGPEFETREGEVVMRLHICVGYQCWDVHGIPPESQRAPR